MELSNERDDMNTKQLERSIENVTILRATCGHVDQIGHILNMKCGKCVRRDNRRNVKGKR